MIRVDGPRFADEHGRELLLRGVNLGGSSKVPAKPDGASWRQEGFFRHREVSFVGRPFPLAEADAHFARLKRWGLTTLRFLTTWEAVEHAGPRQYDAAYLEYLEAVVRKAGEAGFHVFVDFHQDVWSRFSGGDGAPGWTLEAAGFQVEHLHETGAAFVHCQHDGPLPKMIWPSNTGKLASATMFTLFFGGDAFAPKLRIDGTPAQRYLQEHFLGAVEQVARRLRGVEGVFGYDVLNEPSAGYIGWKDLTRWGSPVAVGALPSPLESFALGDGQARTVKTWHRGVLGKKVTGAVKLNPRGLRAWREGVTCPWREHGVWDLDARGEPKLERPAHFSHLGGRRVDFNEDFYRPFLRTAAERVHRVSPNAVVFLEAVPQQPGPSWQPADAAPVAYAPHWYDGFVLFMKDFRSFLGVDFDTEAPVFGASRVRKSCAEQLERFRTHARHHLGNVPVLLGEFGIAFDLRGKKAFTTGDYSVQEAAMDRSLTALEDAKLSGTLWNYTADNTHAHGDGWNDEDLSIFSPDGMKGDGSVDDGGRALAAVVRPYPRAVAGELVRYGFDRKSRRFEVVLRTAAVSEHPTEVFVPVFQYPKGVEVTHSGGRFEHDEAVQVLRYWPSTADAEHRLTLKPRS